MARIGRFTGMSAGPYGAALSTVQPIDNVFKLPGTYNPLLEQLLGLSAEGINPWAYATEGKHNTDTSIWQDAEGNLNGQSRNNPDGTNTPWGGGVNVFGIAPGPGLNLGVGLPSIATGLGNSTRNGGRSGGARSTEPSANPKGEKGIDFA